MHKTDLLPFTYRNYGLRVLSMLYVVWTRCFYFDPQL